MASLATRHTVSLPRPSVGRCKVLESPGPLRSPSAKSRDGGRDVLLPDLLVEYLNRDDSRGLLY